MTTTIRIAAFGLLFAAAALACSAADPSATDGEHTGEAQQAICADPPCLPIGGGTSGRVSSSGTIYDPGPSSLPTFTCSGLAPNKVDHYKMVDGKCVIVGCPPDDPHCWGYSVLSSYVCPPTYPVLRCNTYGQCNCWTY